jgi:hypothetical protein
VALPDLLGIMPVSVCCADAHYSVTWLEWIHVKCSPHKRVFRKRTCGVLGYLKKLRSIKNVFMESLFDIHELSENLVILSIMNFLGRL